MTKVLELFEKDFKVTITKMLQQTIMNTLETNTKRESPSTNIKALELKNITIELRTSNDGLNSRKEKTEKRISELDDKTVK